MLQRIKNYYHFLVAVLANVRFGFPSRKLTVIGVTGTDGKTTTVSLIYHILKSCGYNASMITSIGAKISGNDYDIGFHVTTPSSFALQGFLKKAIESSAKNFVPARSVPSSSSRESSRLVSSRFQRNYLVLEVTSHSLDQFRVWGIGFKVGVLTNVTHEHLDYHKTYKNYVLTKAKLLKMSGTAVINIDDESYKLISKIQLAPGRKSKFVTYGINEKAEISPKKFPFKTKLIGEFNKYNVLAAIGACLQLGLKREEILKAIETFEAPSGREEIIFKNGFTVMVDFAHTPNSFWKVLPEAKKLTQKRLIHVFGAAGKRDFTKRPEMGKTSSSFADIIVLTAEDPRGEPLKKIFFEIKQGIKAGFKIVDYKTYVPNKSDRKIIFEIPRREDAINFAISIAKEGDFIITTGKSHEKSMNYGKGEELWDEFEVAMKAIREKENQ